MKPKQLSKQVRNKVLENMKRKRRFAFHQENNPNHTAKARLDWVKTKNLNLSVEAQTSI